MKKWKTNILAGVIAGICYSYSDATASINIYETNYPGTYYEQDVSTTLRDIASFLGLDLVLKEEPKGTVNNNDAMRSVGELLDVIALEKTFLWYVANGIMYIVPDTDMAQVVFDIRDVDTNEIDKKILDLGVYNPKYQIRYDSAENTALMIGPSGYVDLIANIILISGGEQLGVTQDNNNVAENRKNAAVPRIYRGRSGG